jgi:O-antigen/teichoic acid export membrane protein
MNRHISYFSTLFSGHVFNKFLGVITLMLMARWLSRGDEFDHIASGLALMTLVITISDAGLMHLGLSEAAKPQSRFNTAHIFTARFTNFLFTIPLAVLMIFFIPAPAPLKSLYIIFIFISLIESFKPEWYFQGNQKFTMITAAHAGAVSLYLLLICAGFYFSLSYFWIPVFYLAAFSTEAVFLYIKSPFRLSFFPLWKDKNLIRASFFMGITKILQQLPITAPPLIITAMTPLSPHIQSGAAAGFAVSFKCILLAKIFDAILGTLFISSLPKYWSHNQEKTRKQVCFLYRSVIFFTVCAAMLLSILSPFLLRVLFGPEFVQNSITLSILTFYFIFTTLNTLLSYGLLSLGGARSFFHSSLLPLSLTFPLLFAGTYFWGENGAALAIVVMEGCFFLHAFGLFKTYIRLPKAEHLLIFLAAIVLIFIHTRGYTALSISAAGLLIITSATLCALSAKRLFSCSIDI